MMDQLTSHLLLLLASISLTTSSPITQSFFSSPGLIQQQTIQFSQDSTILHPPLPQGNTQFFQSGNFLQPAVETVPSVQTLSHPEVVQNAIAESQLPPELTNPFYRNPAVARGLARESWLANKEYVAEHRDTEDIPRSEIFKLINRIEHKA